MLTIEKKDEATVKVTSVDHGSLMELSEFFTFMADGYQFVPSYKAKMWDGKIRLFNMRTKELPAGLLPLVSKFCKDRGYEMNVDIRLKPAEIGSDEYLMNFITKLNLQSDGKKIHPRDYQISSFKKALRDNKCLVVSPTGSGKSLLIYMLIRYYMEHFEGKAVVVVPTTSLVEQMYGDFLDYSKNDPTFDESDIHKIYSGKDKSGFDSRVVVTTWQSAVNLRPNWFKQFGMVIGDESHLFKAKSLNSIMKNLVNAKFRIGTTGTLDDSKVNKLTLIGNFGQVFDATTTRELMDRGDLATLDIKCLILKHPKELCKVVKNLKYKEEIDVIVSHPTRNKFISNLALDQKGNTLVLFNYVESHGKPLFEMIKSMNQKSGRDIFFVSGEVKAEDRNKIRELTEKGDGTIIVASLGTFSTGISIKNLHNIIFASPSKSTIKVLQSIGRGLRKAKNGQSTLLYDLTDDFRVGKSKNFTFKHGMHRVGIYDKQSFEYSTIEIDMPM
jgi:superfamily II DNA or RNA helicase